MTYRINEIFYSVQGEGRWTGRPAVFVRFSGCNLWSGAEQDRATAICKFCDTTFTDYTEYGSTGEVVQAVTALLPDSAWDRRTPMVVITGGEPMLQFDADLARALLSVPMYVAIETNGTKPIPFHVDWVCVSPKTPLIKTGGNELKLVYPQQRITPEMFDTTPWDHTWLSPMDGPNLQQNTEAAFQYCLNNPEWSLNVQTHKVIGVR
jgi:7-carboxy-7-deazaguanine synthase (Cx14CxxC type)